MNNIEIIVSMTQNLYFNPYPPCKAKTEVDIIAKFVFPSIRLSIVHQKEEGIVYSMCIGQLLKHRAHIWAISPNYFHVTLALHGTCSLVHVHSAVVLVPQFLMYRIASNLTDISNYPDTISN